MIELTDHVKAYRWPKGLRLVIRREPRHPGAKRSLFDSEDYRYWGHWTDQPQPAPETDRDMRAHAQVNNHIARVKDHGGNRFPFTKYAPNRLWLHTVALADTPLRWFQKLSLPKQALRISVGSDGGEEVPVGFPGVEKGPDSVVREVG